MFILAPNSEVEVNTADITSHFTFLGEDSDPIITNSYGTDDGLDGIAYVTQTHSQNVVNAKFMLRFNDYYDYQMKKHSLARFFGQKGLYRIRTDSEPAKVKYVYAGNFTIAPTEDGSNTALITIPFDNPSGLKYSLGYSDEVMTYDKTVWQLGMNLPMNESLQYEYNAIRSFKIYNASDIEVDPIQHHQLQLIVRNTTGQVSIYNTTTDTHVAYTGSLKATDELLWDGVNCYVNGELANNSTDFSYLTLASGFNDIKIQSSADLDVTFHFKFIYLN